MTTKQTKNNALQIAMPDSPVNFEPPEELYRLLSERISRYTMGDSTSVPMETATRLLEGILYCAHLNRSAPVKSLPDSAPLVQRWHMGVLRAKRLKKRAKLLLLEAQRMQPPLTNTAFSDTLVALSNFFRGYDTDFFAHEIPGSIDYPLCHPGSEANVGIEFFLDYLHRWLAESVFLRAFSPEVLRVLYERYYIDYVDLLVNLYLPAAEMAVLCALAGKPVQALELAAEDYASLGLALAKAGEFDARRDILHAADRALEELGLHGTLLRKYIRKTAQDLLVRLRAANTAGKNGKNSID
jgi:hypothetical protein